MTARKSAGQPVDPAAPRLVRLPNRVMGTSVRRYSVPRASVRAVVLSVDGGVRHAAAVSLRLRLQRHACRLLITARLDGHTVLDVHHGMRHESAHRVMSDQVPEPGAR